MEGYFLNGSSAGAIFPQKIASLHFQTSPGEWPKLTHASSRTSRSKLHPNGPELALEENQNFIPSARSKCITRFTRSISHSYLFNSTIVSACFVSQVTWNNGEKIAEMRSYIFR